MLVCIESPQNSKVGYGVLASNNESYNEDECISRASKYVELPTTNTKSLSSTLQLIVKGTITMFILHFIICVYIYYRYFKLLKMSMSLWRNVAWKFYRKRKKCMDIDGGGSCIFSYSFVLVINPWLWLMVSINSLDIVRMISEVKE